MGPFDGSIGAFMIGTTLSVFLAGVTSTQCFTYFTEYPNDRKLWKWMIGFLAVVDVFHTACSVYTTYLWATNFGNLAILVHSPWTFSIDPALTGIVASVVQTFYAYRVYLISGRSTWIPLLIVTLSTVQLGFACGGTAEIFVLNSEFARFQEWTYGVSCWLGFAAAADIVVTSSLCYYLSRNMGAYQRTNSVVDTILRQTIETNGLTMLIAIVDAILFAASKDAWHVIPNLSLVKLYFNSVLVSLNSRQRLTANLHSSENEVSHPSIVKSGTSTVNSRKRALHSRFGATVRSQTSPPPTPPRPVYVSMDVQCTEFVEVSVEGHAGPGEPKPTSAHPFSQLPYRPVHHPFAQRKDDLELQAL